MINIDYHKAAEFIEKDAGIRPYDEINKKGKPYQVVWKGKVVKLRNGKSIWPSLGAAKCALRGKVRTNRLVLECHIGPMRDEDVKKYLGGGIYANSDIEEQAYQEILNQLQIMGILEFKPVV